MQTTSVLLSSDVFLKRIEFLEAENFSLKERIKEEAKIKTKLENEIEFLKSRIDTKPIKTSAKPKPKAGEYSDLKSNGKKKAHKADAIRSYDDFKSIESYFIKNNNFRNRALWVVGIGTGLRFSDLSLIKFKSFLNSDKTFKERLLLHEQKTSKYQNCIITPAIKIALTEYLESINWEYNPNDFVFGFKNVQGWKILNKANSEVKLPINIGTHTMRNSFATIAYCLGEFSDLDGRLEVIQGLLNHSSSLITRRYIGIEQARYDKARNLVSDFMLGKTEMNILEVKKNDTAEKTLEKIDKIEELIEYLLNQNMLKVE